MKQKTILVLAVLVLLIPFLGFPSSWQKAFFVIIALTLTYAAYHQEIKNFFAPREPSGTIATNTFVEHVPESKDSKYGQD